jgi:hypothetical protein
MVPTEVEHGGRMLSQYLNPIYFCVILMFKRIFHLQLYAAIDENLYDN